MRFLSTDRCGTSGFQGIQLVCITVLDGYRCSILMGSLVGPTTVLCL
jgi:hypothetical protein